jgi:hypothetical protein
MLRRPSTPITEVKAQADFWNPTGGREQAHLLIAEPSPLPPKTKIPVPGCACPLRALFPGSSTVSRGHSRHLPPSTPSSASEQVNLLIAARSSKLVMRV